MRSDKTPEDADLVKRHPPAFQALIKQVTASIFNVCTEMTLGTSSLYRSPVAFRSFHRLLPFYRMAAKKPSESWAFSTDRCAGLLANTAYIRRWEYNKYESAYVCLCKHLCFL